MPLLYQANLVAAERLLLHALHARGLEAEAIRYHRSEPAVTLAELVPGTDIPTLSQGTHRHYGTVSSQLARLVYALGMYDAPATAPPGMPAKGVYVVDLYEPPSANSRTGYLAVTIDGPPVLLPMPDLPAVLLKGAGTVADSWRALQALAIRISDLVNVAIPAARALAPAPRLEQDAATLPEALW